MSNYVVQHSEMPSFYCRGTIISRLNLDERLTHNSLVEASRCLNWEEKLLLYDRRTPDKCIVIVKPVLSLLKCKFTFQFLIVLIKVTVKTVPFCRCRNRDFSHSPKAKKEASQLDYIFGLLTGSLVPVTESSRVTEMSFYTPVSKLPPLREHQQKPVEFGHSQITLLGAIGYRNHYALIILVLGQTRFRAN